MKMYQPLYVQKILKWRLLLISESINHIKLITFQQKHFLMYISYVAVYAYLTSSGLTTVRRVLYVWLSKLIIYVYDQFVTVSPLWNTLQS